MVKVIGKDESVVKRVTCRGCASILEYTQAEVQRRHGTDYSGGSDGSEWVTCPTCGHAAVIRSW